MYSYLEEGPRQQYNSSKRGNRKQQYPIQCEDSQSLASKYNKIGFELRFLRRHVPVPGVAKTVPVRKDSFDFFSLNTGYRAGLIRWVSSLRLSVLNAYPAFQISF